jgi:hypothetical protein
VTRDEILALKPGAELDRLVQSKVWGWLKPAVLNPSTEVADAMYTVEKLAESNRFVSLHRLPQGGYRCEVWGGNGAVLHDATAETAAHAVCVAALLATEGKS